MNTFLVCSVHTWAGLNIAAVSREESYIIYFLRPYFKNYGKRPIKSPKVYFIDPSIVSALTRQPFLRLQLVDIWAGCFLRVLL